MLACAGFAGQAYSTGTTPLANLAAHVVRGRVGWGGVALVLLTDLIRHTSPPPDPSLLSGGPVPQQRGPERGRPAVCVQLKGEGGCLCCFVG